MEFFIKFRYNYKEKKLLEFGACSRDQKTSFFGDFEKQSVTEIFTNFYDFLAAHYYPNDDSPHEFIAWGHEDARYAKELYPLCRTQKGCAALALIATGTRDYLAEICNFLGKPYISLTSVYQYFHPDVEKCNEHGNAEAYALRLEDVYMRILLQPERKEEMRKTLGEAYYQVDPTEIRKTLDKLGGRKHLQYLPVGTIYTKKRGGPTQVFASIGEAVEMLYPIVGKNGTITKAQVAEKIKNAIQHSGNYGGFSWRVKKAEKEVNVPKK